MSSENTRQALAEYLLRLGDNSLILGQRLSEWCSHAPELEEDVALINIALDLVGQARALLAYAGELEGRGRGENDLAFLRDVREWRNLLLVEQPNGDFAQTIARQLLFDCYAFELYGALCESADPQLAAIAAKSLKEISYHRRHSAEWTLRLGDGTEESQRRMQAAIDTLWPYTGELFESDALDASLVAAGIAPDPADLRGAWEASVAQVLERATLVRPESLGLLSGGRAGLHSEHLGHLLAEMQWLQRAYPGLRW